MTLKRLRIKSIMSGIAYVLYLIAILVIFDVLIMNKLLGFGYPRHYQQENVERYPAPFVEFTGKPGVKDHNEFGFSGPSFKEARDGDLKIAFFGGSTGYVGDPSIPKIVKKELEKLTGQNVFVANFSVVSSHHRQHLHGILEYLPNFSPDVIVFYGGYNETMQHVAYDPRPGYPYNYFYRSETSPWVKLLIENSAIIGEIDKKTDGAVMGLRRLKKDQQPLSESWNKRIVDKYFETLMLASSVAGTMESRKFGKTKFIAFYQPYQVPREFQSPHDDIKNRIRSSNYIVDVSSEYDRFGEKIYSDIVHVKQPANDAMGAKIASVLAERLKLWKSQSRESYP